MNRYGEQKLNLTALQTLLTSDIKPEELSQLLDELLYDYMAMIVKIQLSNCKDKTLHENTSEFMLYLKLLRDVLSCCTTENKDN